jgi:hypothetical protein
MARAYIVLARNDIDSNNLQILDLKPNTSQRVPAYEPPGQTGYLAWGTQANEVTVTTPDANDVVSTTAYGIIAYLMDNVADNDNGNIVLTFARAGAAAGDIAAALAAGTAVTLAVIDAAIQAATGGALSGLTTAHSTGTVEEVLRILAGEVYKLPAGAEISGVAHSFVNPHVRAGAFVTPVTGVDGIVTYPSDWRHVRSFIDTDYLHMSRFNGQLSKLASATYAWINPAFTYGATGTALTIGQGHIATTGIARALIVYDASGNVIVD